MSREICVLHANCQGDALKELLEASPGFAARFKIRHLRNYMREALDYGLIESTRLFLHQYLTPEWGAISTDEVLPRLPKSATALCIPNCFFNGYWPHWVFKPEIIDFTDSLIESLLEKGLRDDDIMRVYLKGSPAFFENADARAQESIAIERKKEAKTPIKYVDLIEDGWRREQMFLTINHPGPRLLAHIAQNILRELGLSPIPEAIARSYVHPHNEFWLPIHPGAARVLKLEFADADTRYPCFGANLTHAEYARVYLACRRNNFTDLPSALAAHARNMQARES